jgi:hypothetical protein
MHTSMEPEISTTSNCFAATARGPKETLHSHDRFIGDIISAHTKPVSFESGRVTSIWIAASESKIESFASPATYEAEALSELDGAVLML